MKAKRSLVLGVGGLACWVIGGVWIAQGVGSLKGSPMTGHPLWSYLGSGLVMVGIVLVAMAALGRPEPGPDQGPDEH